jgi:hypothetical protein
LAAVIDGTTNTIALVEATDALAVEWTKPVEWTADESDPLKGLLGMRPNGFLAGFVDGHTAFIAKQIDPEMLKAAFGRDDRKPITWPDANPGKAAPGRPMPGPQRGAPAVPRPAAK